MDSKEFLRIFFLHINDVPEGQKMDGVTILSKYDALLEKEPHSPESYRQEIPEKTFRAHFNIGAFDAESKKFIQLINKAIRYSSHNNTGGSDRVSLTAHLMTPLLENSIQGKETLIGIDMENKIETARRDGSLIVMVNRNSTELSIWLKRPDQISEDGLVIDSNNRRNLLFRASGTPEVITDFADMFKTIRFANIEHT